MAYGRGGYGGYGGNNMQQMIKQAQEMQREIQKAQEELENAELVGEAGGGAVKVTVNGKKVFKNITIDSSVVDPEDVEMLEDLIVAAFNAANELADKLYEEKLGAYSKMGGGMF